MNLKQSEIEEMTPLTSTNTQKPDETVHIVFGRWESGDKEHIVGLFWNKKDAEKEAKEALVGEVPRFDTWTREFWVK